MKFFPIVTSALLAVSLQESAVPLQTLMGLRPEEVASKLDPKAASAAPGFVAVVGSARIGIISPVEIARTPSCAWSLKLTDEPIGTQTLLVFDDDLLKVAKQVGPLRTGPVPMPSASTGSAFTAWMEQPQANPLIVAPGELPLQRGVDDVVTHLPDAPGGSRMQQRCGGLVPPIGSVARLHRRHADVAGDLQGLALAPFAVQLPSLNAERERAQREGPEALAELSPGAAAPGGVSGFLDHHHGVYAERGAGGYRILVFNLGAPPSRNLSRMNAYAFAGVRGDMVEWISGPSGALNAMIAAGLCEGLDHRPTRRRRGCTEYGMFSP